MINNNEFSEEKTVQTTPIPDLEDFISRVGIVVGDLWEWKEDQIASYMLRVGTYLLEAYELTKPLLKPRELCYKVLIKSKIPTERNSETTDTLYKYMRFAKWVIENKELIENIQGFSSSEQLTVQTTLDKLPRLSSIKVSHLWVMWNRHIPEHMLEEILEDVIKQGMSKRELIKYLRKRFPRRPPPPRICPICSEVCKEEEKGYSWSDFPNHFVCLSNVNPDWKRYYQKYVEEAKEEEETWTLIGARIRYEYADFFDSLCEEFDLERGEMLEVLLELAKRYGRQFIKSVYKQIRLVTKD